MELRYLFKKTNQVAPPASAAKELSLDEAARRLREGEEAALASLEDGQVRRPAAPEGIIMRCVHCGKTIFTEDLLKNLGVCPECSHHTRVSAKERIREVCDEGTFEEWDSDIGFANPLDTPGYEEKLQKLKAKTSLNEAVVTGRAKIGGLDAVLGVMDSTFMMASMGKIVGEKITRAVERATEMRLPVIIFTCSGGARMQEGIVSLMQMAKTSAALKRHSDAGLLYISVLTDPTTGGVSASFAMLGDIILAEPDALIGFAGPRVISQTIGQELPEGFQRSEFLLHHGFVDAIVDRRDMKETHSNLISRHLGNDVPKFNPPEKPRSHSTKNARRSAWDKVCLSRQKERPIASDYIERIFPDFFELHGDRSYGDDKAIIGGLATFHGVNVTVIAEAKGKSTSENVSRNFGMPSPEGYRKALRLMKQAEKFGRPVLLFVDTPGAYCGIEAEERGQAQAIADNLYQMSSLKTPIFSVVIGEGGSGGALAMAVADEVWMMENAIYAILSPEGYASILWKDATLAPKASEEMKLSSEYLLKMKIIDGIVPEPKEDLNKENFGRTCDYLERVIKRFLCKYMEADKKALPESRYDRFRAF